MIGRHLFFSYLVSISSLEAGEQEEVELVVFRASLDGGLLDEVAELGLADVRRVASQIVLHFKCKKIYDLFYNRGHFSRSGLVLYNQI